MVHVSDIVSCNYFQDLDHTVELVEYNSQSQHRR